tara:strand:- start:317 stop:670 length:354 start_codon:yes stop_codon:yes gene_type:complete
MSNKRPTVKSLLEMIDAKINHIEDITADDRQVLIKLVKQTNQIVKFLSKLEVEEYQDDLDDLNMSLLDKREETNSKKAKHIKELIEEFMSRREEMKEFEEELKKNKIMLTPGQVGEA